MRISDWISDVCSSGLQHWPASRSREHDRCLADLMRSAQDGDRTAYARLLGEVSPLLRQIVRRRYCFLQPSDIEDIVQEILLSLHVARATYDPQRPFLPRSEQRPLGKSVIVTGK